MSTRIKLLRPRITDDDPIFELPPREPDHLFKFLDAPLIDAQELRIWYVGESEDMIRTYVAISDMGGGWAGAYLRRIEPWEIIGDIVNNALIALGYVEGEDLLDPENTWVRD